MVEYSGGENIFEEEDVDTSTDSVNDAITSSNLNANMPDTLPGTLFNTPAKPEIMPALYDDPMFAQLLVNKEAFADQFSSPKMTSEELEEMFPKTDLTSEKWFAFAKAGLQMMQPTMGGAIAPSIAAAGTNLLNDIGTISSAQRKADSTRRQGMLSQKQKEDAERLSLMAQAFGMNQSTLTTGVMKTYEERAKTNASMWENYNKVVNSNMEEAMKFGIKKFESKPVTIRYNNEEGVVKEGAGFLVNDQYYVPTTQKDPESGEWIYQIVPDANSVEIISTKNQDVNKATKGMSQYIQVRGAFDTVDKALYSLDQIYRSLDPETGGDPSRAGFIAGIQKKIQSYAQIGSDFTSQFFTDNPYEENGKTQNKTAWVTDMVDIIAYSDTAPKGLKTEFANISTMLNDLESEGYALMKRDFTTGNPLDEDNKAFENEEQRNLIFGRIKYDTKLPENEARAQAIIYALARARKSSGRLNLDDIERAAQSLNIYGEDAVGVMTKLGVVREDLLNDRRNQLNILKRFYPDAVADLISERGSEDYSYEYYDELFKNQGQEKTKTYGVTFEYGDNGEIIGSTFN